MNNYDYEHITIGLIPDPCVERDFLQTRNY